LQIFRDVDADPSLPDLYTRTAATLSHVPVEEVTKPMRQRGKVAELALGYCGGVGALLNMAAGYGLHLTDAEARTTVDAWRAANPWAINYSRDLWDAMLGARANPGAEYKAGRVTFVFAPMYLGGTLLCQLPSGRYLTYRALRREMVDVKDEDGNVTGQSLEMTFARGYGRQKLWPGMFSENVTQAVAATSCAERWSHWKMKQQTGCRCGCTPMTRSSARRRRARPRRPRGCSARSCAAASTGARACR
jgi:DNA polymerase